MRVAHARGHFVPIAAAAAAIVIAVPFWPTFVSPNEWPRLYQALAVVHRGSLSINEEVARWGSCEDLSIAFGRLYPNKAPGLLPLLLPGTALAHLFAHGPQELKLAYFWGRLLAVTLPWFLTSWVAATHLRRRWGEAGGLMAGVLAAGSPWLVAGEVVFAHTLAGACLFGGLLLSQGRWRLSLGAAGFCWGWAAISEYPTALLGGAWLLWLTWEKGRRVWPAFLGFVFPLLCLFSYNWRCFGDPLVLSSARELFPQFSALGQVGFYGISWPKLANLVLFLLSPERGLLFWSPLLLLGFLPSAGDSLVQRSWFGATLLLVVLSGYGNAHGGWFPGSRYLLVAFPLLALSTAPRLASRWSSPWVKIATFALVFWGIPWAWLPLFTFPLSPPDFPASPVSFHWALLQGGVFVSGLLSPLGTITTLLSLALVVLGGFLLCFHQHRSAFLGLALAGALWALVASTMPPLAFRPKLELAVVHDVYVGKPDPSWLLALLPTATPEQKQVLWRWLNRRPR